MMMDVRACAVKFQVAFTVKTLFACLLLRDFCNMNKNTKLKGINNKLSNDTTTAKGKL